FPLVFVRRDTLWKGTRPLRWVILAGACFAADLYFWHRSILYVGPGLATLLGNFQVFFVAAAGLLVFHERATPRFLVSVPLALLGLFLLVGVRWGTFDADYRRGVLFGILTALSYGAYLLCLRAARRERNRLSAVANLALSTVFTAAILGAVAGVRGESLHIPSVRTASILVAYGVLCQALGWIIISRTLHVVDASRAALILMLQPALTYLWDVLFFRRPMTAVEAGGAALAIAAIYLGNSRPAPAPPAT
ncbi:MAG TPA: DMT family transporter, partial [Candidatus Krumholzibacteria bacterium]|nr:DMT family transporter [Candidatus Krumholzibacteria bacterium]